MGCTGRQGRLTQAQLQALLRYVPETGIFYWRVPVGNIPAGSVAGGGSRGRYSRVSINRVRYYLHRLAWLYVTGRHPEAQIDHINATAGTTASPTYEKPSLPRIVRTWPPPARGRGNLPERVSINMRTGGAPASASARASGAWAILTRQKRRTRRTSPRNRSTTPSTPYLGAAHD